jgi:hypothetical protein
MRRFLCALLLGGCTFNWNGGEPGLPLVGEPPPSSAFEKLNTAPVGRANLMIGPDSAPWTAFCEFWSAGSGNNGRNCKRMHLVRLGPPEDPPAEEVFEADDFGVHNQMLYLVHEDMAAHNRTVTMHRPGDPRVADVDFVLGGDQAAFVVNDSGAADVFLYWIQSATTTESTDWTIHRRDQAYERHLPLPAGINPNGAKNEGLALLFDAAGDTLVVRTPDGTTTAYSTLDEGAVPLGQRPPDLFIDDPRAQLVAIGMDGLRALPLAGGTDTVFTPLPVDRSSVNTAYDQIYFHTDAGLWRAPLDGSTAAALIQPGAARARAVGPHGEVAYGNDPASLYAGGAGDGWLGDWKFMERGRTPRFSADGARLHFLEHAATLGTYGDLTLATGPADPVRTLSINVHAWDELADGRLIAIENAIQRGTWNRMVVIDELAGERRWLVPGAAEFFLVPGKREIIVDAVSGASGYDILRVPAP